MTFNDMQAAVLADHILSFVAKTDVLDAQALKTTRRILRKQVQLNRMTEEEQEFVVTALLLIEKKLEKKHGTGKGKSEDPDPGDHSNRGP